MVIRTSIALTYPGFIQHRGRLTHWRKGTAPTYRAALRGRKAFAGAMGGGKHITNAETSSDLLTTRSR
jgi:hypothetical protein